MTPAQFISWLAAMKAAGLARSDAECGRLLGVSKNSIVSMKKKGVDHRTGLGCRALFHRLPVGRYPEVQPPTGVSLRQSGGS